MIKFAEYINDFKHENQRIKAVRKLVILMKKQQMDLFQDKRNALLEQFQIFIIQLIDNQYLWQNLAALNILENIINNAPIYLPIHFLEKQIISLCFNKSTCQQASKLVLLLQKNEDSSNILQTTWYEVDSKISQKQFKPQICIMLSNIAVTNIEKAQGYIKHVYESEEIQAFVALLKIDIGYEYLINVLPKGHSVDILKQLLEQGDIQEPSSQFILYYPKILQLILDKPKYPIVFSLMSTHCRDVFILSLPKIMSYLLTNHSLVEIANIIQNVGQQHISTYFKQIWNEISQQNFSEDALICIKILAKECSTLVHANRQIISQKIFQQQLSEYSINAIQYLNLQELNYQLLQTIAVELTGIALFDINYDFTGKYTQNSILCLQSLIQFDFDWLNLTDFCTDYITRYLTHSSSKVRCAAGSVILKHIQNSNNQVVNMALTQVIITIVSDVQKQVRYELSKQLLNNSKFDDYLALQENIEILFVSVSDQEFSVRHNIFEVIGRISSLNPTFVLPKIREIFLSQVFELNQKQLDLEQRKQALSLMLTLVNSCYVQLIPYFASAIDSIFNVFILDRDQEIILALQILQQMFICNEIYIHLPKAVNIIYLQICSKNKSIVQLSLLCLQNIVYNTGVSVVPYTINDNLFKKLVQLILTDEELKESAAKTLVILGVINKQFIYKIPEELSFIVKKTEKVSEIISHGAAVFDIITDTVIDKNEIVKLNIVGQTQIKDNDLLTHIFQLLIGIIKEESNYKNQLQAVILIRKILKKPDISTNLIQEALTQIINLVQNSDNTEFQDSLLQELIIIVHFLENGIKIFARQLFSFTYSIMLQDQLLSKAFILMEELSKRLPQDDFIENNTALIEKLLYLYTQEIIDIDLVISSYNLIIVLLPHLKSQLKLIIPQLFVLTNHKSQDFQIATLDVIGRIFAYIKINNVSSLTVQSLILLMKSSYYQFQQSFPNQQNSFSNNPVGMKAFETLQIFACSTGKKFKIFIPIINDVMMECQYYSYVFNAILSLYLNNILIDQYLAVQFITEYYSKTMITDNYVANVLHSNVNIVVNKDYQTEQIVEQFLSSQTSNIVTPIPPSTSGYDQLQLQIEQVEVVNNIPKKVWVCEDILDEMQWRQWIQNFNLALISHSPVPIIRDCYELATNSVQFAKSLLNYSFFSFITDNNMVNELRSTASQTLKSVFQSSTIPQDIQLLFLDLMEFLEHQQIQISYLLDHNISLSKVSDRCCAYARSLRYREQESLTKQLNTDILMQINQQLGYLDSINGLVIVQQQDLILRGLLAIRFIFDEQIKFVKDASFQPYFNQENFELNFKEKLDQYLQNLSDINIQNAAIEDIFVSAGIFSQIEDVNVVSIFQQLLFQYKEQLGQIQQHLQFDVYNFTLELIQTYFNMFALGIDLKPKLYEYKKEYELAILKYDQQITTLYTLIQRRDFSKLKEQIRQYQLLQIQKIQCYYNSGFYELVLEEANKYKQIDFPIDQQLQIQFLTQFQQQVALICAQAAYELQNIQQLNDWLLLVGEDQRNILQILQFLKNEEFTEAQSIINIQFKQLLSLVQSALSESYQRAYPILLQLQDICLLEEVLYFKSHNDKSSHLQLLKLKQIWDIRIENSSQTQNTIKIRQLILLPQKDEVIYLTFADLCLKEKKLHLALKQYQLLQKSSSVTFNNKIQFNLLKYKWDNNMDISIIQDQLNDLLEQVDNDKILKSDVCIEKSRWIIKEQASMNSINVDILTELKVILQQSIQNNQSNVDDNGISQQAPQSPEDSVTTVIRLESLRLLEKAAVLNANNIQIQTELGNLAFSYIELYQEEKDYLIKTAFRAFFVCIRANQFIIASILKIIQIWSQNQEALCQIFLEEMQSIDIKTFIHAVPQLLSKKNNTIYSILKDLALAQPQFMAFPLQVATKRIDVNYQSIAYSILEEVRRQHPLIVTQMIEFQKELNKVAILWPEMAYDSINAAVLAYNSNKKQMQFYNSISQIHSEITQNKSSQSEKLFQDQFLSIFLDSFTKLKQGIKTSQIQLVESAKQQLIELVHQLNLSLNLTSIELEFASPYLFQLRNSIIPLPGQDSEQLTVLRMLPRMNVMRSKQRPRKMALVGSDGEIYAYLLKGREDLRLDERVMQLFKLNNALMNDDHQCSIRQLKILRYPVTPLGRTSGMLFWVPKTETLHDMIKQQRQLHNVQEMTEDINFKQRAAPYSNCSLLQKIECYKNVMEVASSQDLRQAIWDDSSSAEDWLLRRTAFASTLAVMSGVGHILGLGDRHPQNIMVTKSSGHVLHIDFGDCFEAAMMRQKLPEKVPFRLTKMLINALEANGINGHFFTCFRLSMSVFRKEKLAIMAIFETFREDPLVREDDLTPDVFINRIKVKLEGREFDTTQILSVNQQVNYLIKSATNVENLCQSYVGWCPFW
ncbi:Kinase, PIKK [Spironucleus salmonicida]|uniref:Kinase, PIKK n=1 Tax=Spironucleus salmonicida TaxID=348837 RepID=V6LDB6_9EUKA|nr:Kinase, PIKK [Spironucleus salmonicida]|eukprot:EST42228.1 Kinase, PIKK [Spironucleus salmonicida]